MVFQKRTINNVPTLVPLTADTGSGVPVGTIIGQYKKVNMAGYLYLDGSTFDQTLYPALYAYLGTNVLPDYREFVLVGAEQNSTSATIATHDVFTQGQEKDDALQSHNHGINFSSENTGSKYGLQFTQNVSENYDLTVMTANTGREALVTRTKEKAVFWYIKATTGIIESEATEMLNLINENIDRITQGTVTAVSSKISQIRRTHVLYKNGIGYLAVEFDLNAATSENEILFTIDKSAYVTQVFVVATGYISGTSSGVLRVEGNNVICGAPLPAGIVWGGGCSFIVSQ